jgi:hypothetical protein
MLKDNQFLHVRVAAPGYSTQFILEERVYGERYAWSFILEHEKIVLALNPTALFGALLANMQSILADGIREKRALRDRKGNPIKTIYRNRNAMKPPRENVNRSQEKARRVRQMERQKAKAERKGAAQ